MHVYSPTFPVGELHFCQTPDDPILRSLLPRLLFSPFLLENLLAVGSPSRGVWMQQSFPGLLRAFPDH